MFETYQTSDVLAPSNILAINLISSSGKILESQTCSIFAKAVSWAAWFLVVDARASGAMPEENI